MVGTASFDEGRVRSVFVDAARHGRGIGDQLMAAIEAHAQQLKKIYLSLSISAVEFYINFGYKLANRADYILNDIPMPVVHLEKNYC